MLMRRIVDHLRTQNWTAVGIEFLIVVAGVFLGIQLGNWNEARLATEQERALVLQLISDAEEARTVIDGRIETSASRTEDARRMHGYFLDRTLPESDDTFADELLEIGRWSDDGFVRTTLLQALANGSVTRIRSARAQRAIAEFRENIESIEAGLHNMGGYNLENTMAIRRQADIREAASGSEMLTPADDVLANETMRRIVSQLAFSNGVIARYHRDSREVNEAYRSALLDYANERGWRE